MNYPPQGPPPGGMPPGGMPPGGMPPQGNYPGGSYFPPQANQPYPPPPGHHQPKKRSSIPMVIGILMLVFGGLGLLFTLIGFAGDSSSPFMDSEFKDKWETFQTWETVSRLLGLVLGLLHVFGGIQAVRYARNAPTLAMAYGWTAIAFNLISVILVFAWLKPMFEGIPAAGAIVGFAAVMGGIIGMAWPIIVLALMSRPAAKEACNN